MKSLLMVLSLFILLSGCQNRVGTTRKIPSGVIGKARMARILADVHIAESIYPAVKNNDSAKMKLNTAYEVIFKKYGITRQDFERSMDFYSKNPDILEDIYDSVTEILNTRKIE